MPDYAKTVIYKIVCKDVNIKKSYGGHTTNIIKRRQQHKNRCNNENYSSYNFYVYKFIRENGGWDNWEVVWNYDFPCETKREAELEERKFIELNNCELNSHRPIISEEEKKQMHESKRKENYEKNKDKIKQKNKEWREKNKEKIKEWRKNNKEKIKCECGCEILKINLSKHLKTKKHIRIMNEITI